MSVCPPARAGRGAAPGPCGGRRAEGPEGGTDAGAEGGEREEMGHPQPGQKRAARCLEGHGKGVRTGCPRPWVCALGGNQWGSALGAQQEGFRVGGFGAGKGTDRGRESRIGRGVDVTVLGAGGEEQKLPDVTIQASSACPRSQPLAIAAPHGEAAPRVGRPMAAPRRQSQPLSPAAGAAVAASLCLPARAL